MRVEHQSAPTLIVDTLRQAGAARHAQALEKPARAAPVVDPLRAGVLARAAVDWAAAALDSADLPFAAAELRRNPGPDGLRALERVVAGLARRGGQEMGAVLEAVNAASRAVRAREQAEHVLAERCAACALQAAIRAVRLRPVSPAIWALGAPPDPVFTALPRLLRHAAETLSSALAGLDAARAA